MYGSPTTPQRDSLTVEIMAAVAAEEGVDQTALPPLADVIDPDALDVLIDSVDDAAPSDARVQFPYAGYTVQIDADRTVTID